MNIFLKSNALNQKISGENLVSHMDLCWIFKCWIRIHKQRPQKPPSTKFHPKSSNFLHYRQRYCIRYFQYLNVDLRFIISVPKYRILYQSRNLLHFGPQYWSAVSNFLILSSDSESATPKPPSTKYHRNQVIFAFLSAILDSPFWISEFWAGIHNQRPQECFWILNFKSIKPEEKFVL